MQGFLSAGQQVFSIGQTLRRLVPFVSVVFWFAAVASLVGMGQGRMGLALFFLGLLTISAFLSINFAICCTVAFVCFVGDLRRLLITVFEWTGTDPLLLVSGSVALILFINALAKGDVAFSSRLAKAVLALMAVMLAQIFNPVQGGLMVGIAGALFLFVPMLWFWLGRIYGTPRMIRTVLLYVVLPVGVAASAMGLYQSFNGYLPHQQMWLEQNWYAGLGSPDNPSPISIFSSNTEYGTFLTIATVVAWGAFLSGRRVYILLVPLFMTASLLTGVRGPVIFALATMALTWAAMGRDWHTWLARGSIAVLIAGAGYMWVLKQSSNLTLDAHVQARLDRHAQEFVDRGEEDYSSVGTHFDMLLGGYKYAIIAPLGRGLGITTQAASKFGTGGYSTEHSLSDSFLSLGIIGGVIYHIVVILVAVAMYRLWRKDRGIEAVLLLGVILATYANWLSGGQYAVMTVALFCVGAMDRLSEHRTSGQVQIRVSR